jgi:hypothetical protein
VDTVSRLLNDLCFVASGLRPCFLFDYASVDAHVVASLLTCLREQTAEHGQDYGRLFAHLRLLTLGGEHFVVQPTNMRHALGEMVASGFENVAVVFVDEGLHAPKLAGHSFKKQLAEKVDTLRRCLEREDVSLPTASSSWTHGDMVCLTGLLLGYPCVYAWEHTPEDGGAANNCLSCTNLSLFQPVLAVKRAVQNSRASAPSRDQRARQETTQGVGHATHPLFSFSVPESVLGSEEVLKSLAVYRSRQLQKCQELHTQCPALHILKNTDAMVLHQSMVNLSQVAL